ncbi:MAG TPA: tetratricopeptide repeat protein [Gemmatimonadales bacterium]|nr:tetratricopeptide repeat protein [Gemmatimonadales bacterium]
MAAPGSRLRDSDAADRAYLLKVAVFFGPACFVMLSLVWYFMHKREWISGGVEAMLTVLNIPVTIGAIFAIHRAVGAASSGLVKTMFAVGDIAPPRTYPRQDVLIAHGKYEEAAEWFRDHLRIEPDDHEARLKLAQLLETQLKRYDEAECLYLEIRNAEPPANKNQRMRTANGLIDLYRKTGRIDRLKGELLRFADQYRGTPLADGAARELSELAESNPTSESRRFPT